MRIEITALLDQDVYTQKGIFVGRVDDVVLDPDVGEVSGLALGSLNKSFLDLKGKGIIIPYQGVTAVGDIIITKHFGTVPVPYGDEKKD
ncbi:MAG TPA: PRC-barrel domain-containing protein [Methanothrix sp.]|nr:PRC-barrel domain-containing protein [Methanothrix sp.]